MASTGSSSTPGKLTVSPTARVSSSWRRMIRSAGTDTVTMQELTVGCLLVSSGLAVMVAMPPPTAVTLPFSSTVATEGSLEDQVTFWFVASGG